MTGFCNATLKLFFSLGLICIFLSLIGFFSGIFPWRIHSHYTPSYLNIPYKNVTFMTRDHIKIRGWYIENSNPKAKTIIILHGYPADKGDILPLTYYLHKRFNLLYFDFRRLGESSGWFSTLGSREVLDLKAAIQYLQQLGKKDIGVLGFSMGGAVALLTAADTPQIKALVVISSYAHLSWLVDDYFILPYVKYFLAQLTRLWGYLIFQSDITATSPVIAAKKIKIPILLIHNHEDKLISNKHAQALIAALRENQAIKNKFKIITGHGSHVTYDKANNVVITNFFLKYLAS